MSNDCVLKIIDHGAWNGGTLTDNSIYENKNMFFKHDIPVNKRTIEQRIGVRTRIVAPDDTRIGILALKDLLEHADFETDRIKVLIGATNVGEDKNETAPLIQKPYELLKDKCPHAVCFDLYAGCPGYNVSVECLLMLSHAGVLKRGDISIVVGAENIHRAKAFPPLDTANIIFGDDAMATAFITTADRPDNRRQLKQLRFSKRLGADPITDLAQLIVEHAGKRKIDGIIIDNQMGCLAYRIPATAARLQHRLTMMMHPEQTARGTWRHFKNSLAFYDQHVDSFAFDIRSLSRDPREVEHIASAYVLSGKYRRILSVYLEPGKRARVALHTAEPIAYKRPRFGIVDSRTRTHGCFADYIQAIIMDNDYFGQMNGKGVFLYATRGARRHIDRLLSKNGLQFADLDLIIEHQANFAIIPMTIEKLLHGNGKDLKQAVFDVVADKMITNIHYRGNCSVVCMQRLPYDLQRDALKTDHINGYIVNRNVAALKGSKMILNDSVGAGMTRSSFLQRTG